MGSRTLTTHPTPAAVEGPRGLCPSFSPEPQTPNGYPHSLGSTGPPGAPGKRVVCLAVGVHSPATLVAWAPHTLPISLWRAVFCGSYPRESPGLRGGREGAAAPDLPPPKATSARTTCGVYFQVCAFK